MSFRKYLTSKVFLAQIITVIAIIGGLAFLFFNSLKYLTNHGEEITIPDLSKMSVEQAEEKLYDLDLDYIILDTVDFREQFPKLTIVEQEPKAGAKVKAGRKIYLKINAETFTMVTVPVGLQEGEITYKPYLGKDMVLEMLHNGKRLKAGDKILKSSRIDLVLGDGKVVFEESMLDSTAVDSIEIIEP
jgi:hypothetical protein